MTQIEKNREITYFFQNCLFSKTITKRNVYVCRFSFAKLFNLFNEQRGFGIFYSHRKRDDGWEKTSSIGKVSTPKLLQYIWVHLETKPLCIWYILYVSFYRRIFKNIGEEFVLIWIVMPQVVKENVSEPFGTQVIIEIYIVIY